jgi:hypothetical protein
MTSEATLDVPTPFSTTASAVPQQAVTAAQNAASPTAESSNSPDQVAGADHGASPSEASTKTSAVVGATSEAINPSNEPTAAMETGTLDEGGSGSLSESGVIDSPINPTADMETAAVGGSGSQSDSNPIHPPSNPTAAMETQKPQLTTPSGDPTATDLDASSHADNSQLSEDTPSSNAAQGVVTSKTSSASFMIRVFPADLYGLGFFCFLLVCLAW